MAITESIKEKLPLEQGLKLPSWNKIFRINYTSIRTRLNTIKGINMTKDTETKQLRMNQGRLQMKKFFNIAEKHFLQYLEYV